MALAAEIAFQKAVIVAEQTRQGSRDAAFQTYAWTAANLAAYKIALADADVAYITAVNTAANTADIQLGLQGMTGPIPTSWASLTGML